MERLLAPSLRLGQHSISDTVRGDLVASAVDGLPQIFDQVLANVGNLAQFRFEAFHRFTPGRKPGHIITGASVGINTLCGAGLGI